MDRAYVLNHFLEGHPPAALLSTAAVIFEHGRSKAVRHIQVCHGSMLKCGQSRGSTFSFQARTSTINPIDHNTHIPLSSDMSTTVNGPAGNLRKRKSNTVLTSDSITNGQSTALLKVNAIPTEHGQEMDKKLDEHEVYEFGGPVGAFAMMTLFPALMCESKMRFRLRCVPKRPISGADTNGPRADYLWICLWYYEGKFVYPTSVNDVGPFFHRMWLHILDVSSWHGLLGSDLPD